MITGKKKNENTNKKGPGIHQPVLNLLLMMVLAAALFGCGGCGTTKRDEVTETQHAKKIKELRTQREANLKERAQAPTIKPKAPAKNFITRAYFAPQLVKAGTHLKIKVDTIFPEDSKKDYYFTYIFWKNGKKMTETSEDTIPPETYKKGDVIYADVILHMGGEMVDKKRSDLVRIINSFPVIKNVKIPKIEGPGSYEITVTAEDADGDKIKYSLLPEAEGKTLFPGLHINSVTGTITCNLGEKPPPEIMKFIIAAEDGDGGVGKKAVTISFEITQKEKPAKEEKEG